MPSSRIATLPALDFTAHMRRLCADFIARLAPLSHIDIDRVAIAYSQTRKRVAHGLWASLTPMRFEGGSVTSRRNDRRYTVERLYGADGREMLYILRFYLPRFLDRTLDEKLSTVVHELWHIGPDFDGDLRRHQGRCFAHGPSQKAYDETIDRFVEQWRATRPDPGVFEFLDGTFSELSARFGGIYGTKIRAPKLISADP